MQIKAARALASSAAALGNAARERVDAAAAGIAVLSRSHANLCHSLQALLQVDLDIEVRWPVCPVTPGARVRVIHSKHMSSLHAHLLLGSAWAALRVPRAIDTAEQAAPLSAGLCRAAHRPARSAAGPRRTPFARLA